MRKKAEAVSVIGGSDGPTAVFFAGDKKEFLLLRDIKGFDI